ncbi:hypothetical protein [Streptomyces spiramyceticus]|uniref:hypothetical protein n=1 Tax=Streptomyces spiramyceticus TaxID=299717 RepID=UPI00237AE134|nr:hypothetical protein [Streptomyces spiramyceticus]
MGTRGKWPVALCATALLVTSLSGCAKPAPSPTFEEKRDAHYAHLKEAGQLGSREALSIQRQKISYGIPRSSSTPTEDECKTRWSDLGLKEETPGAQDTFISICSTFPTPGTPGYADAVAEAEMPEP